MSETSETVLTFRDLKQLKGWPFSSQYTAKLIKAGKFPKPFKATVPGKVNLWLARDIDAFMAAKGRPPAPTPSEEEPS